MIVVTAIMTAKKGNEEKVRELAAKMVSKVKAEKNTLYYSFNQSKNEAQRFVFIEKYSDQAAFDFHSSTDYFKEIVGEIATLLSKEPELEFYTELTSI